MDRTQTIAKYRDAYLKTLSPSRREKFENKAESLQYASIMQWRRKMRIAQETPQSLTDILNAMQHTSALIENATDLSDEDRNTISNNIRMLDDSLARQGEKQKQERIATLRRKMEEMQNELQTLQDN